MNWQAGDLALCVGSDEGGWTCPGGPKIGTVCIVTRVVERAKWCALVVAGYPSIHFTQGWSANSFRKIEPEQHKASEPRREPVPQQKAPLSASGGE